MKKILPIIFLTLFLVGCGDDLCENHITEELSSPEGSYSVIVFDRGCGATTKTIHVATLRKKGAPIDFENYDQWVFTAHGDAEINVSWVNENHLVINYKTEDGAPTKKHLIDGVTVEYLN